MAMKNNNSVNVGLCAPFNGEVEALLRSPSVRAKLHKAWRASAGNPCAMRVSLLTHMAIDICHQRWPQLVASPPPRGPVGIDVVMTSVVDSLLAGWRARS